MIVMSCDKKPAAVEEQRGDAKKVHLVTIDPGHFHAALVQKTMYADVDSVVHVYAPQGTISRSILPASRRTTAAAKIQRAGKRRSIPATTSSRG